MFLLHNGRQGLSRRLADKADNQHTSGVVDVTGTFGLENNGETGPFFRLTGAQVRWVPARWSSPT